MGWNIACPQYTCSAVWSADWGVWSADWDMWSADWGVWSADWGMWSADWGMWSAVHIKDTNLTKILEQRCTKLWVVPRRSNFWYMYMESYKPEPRCCPIREVQSGLLFCRHCARWGRPAPDRICMSDSRVWICDSMCVHLSLGIVLCEEGLNLIAYVCQTWTKKKLYMYYFTDFCCNYVLSDSRVWICEYVCTHCEWKERSHNMYMHTVTYPHLLFAMCTHILSHISTYPHAMLMGGAKPCSTHRCAYHRSKHTYKTCVCAPCY